jgi:hypothetical protein
MHDLSKLHPEAAARARARLKPGEEYRDSRGTHKRIYTLRCDRAGCGRPIGTVGFPVGRPVDPLHPNAGHGTLCEECSPIWEALTVADLEMREAARAEAEERAREREALLDSLLAVNVDRLLRLAEQPNK